MLEDRKFKKLFTIGLLIFLITLIGILKTSSKPQAFGGCGDDCRSCHTLSSSDAEEILKHGGIPDLGHVKVISIGQAPAKGLWEVYIEKNNKKGILYMDFSKKFIIVGQIFELKSSKNVTQERFLEINKVDVTKIPLDDALVMGKTSAKYKVIVFTDPDCPFCGKHHRELKSVIKKRNDIAFYIKLFPLPIHKDAYWKAKSIQCSKSMKLLEDNFEGKAPLQPQCETDIIDKNVSLAHKIGINSTPTIILPNGKLISGVISSDKLIELITTGK